VEQNASTCNDIAQRRRSLKATPPRSKPGGSCELYVPKFPKASGGILRKRASAQRERLEKSILQGVRFKSTKNEHHGILKAASKNKETHSVCGGRRRIGSVSGATREQKIERSNTTLESTEWKGGVSQDKASTRTTGGSERQYLGTGLFPRTRKPPEKGGKKSNVISFKRDEGRN